MRVAAARCLIRRARCLLRTPAAGTSTFSTDLIVYWYYTFGIGGASSVGSLP